MIYRTSYGLRPMDGLQWGYTAIPQAENPALYGVRIHLAGRVIAQAYDIPVSTLTLLDAILPCLHVKRIASRLLS